jgi:hypothetical protein
MPLFFTRNYKSSLVIIKNNYNLDQKRFSSYSICSGVDVEPRTYLQDTTTILMKTYKDLTYTINNKCGITYNKIYI